MNPFLEQTPSRRQVLRAATTGAGAILLGPVFGRQGRAWAADGPLEQLKVHTKVPANAEPALAALAKEWITPVELFYVRSHAPVPEVDTEAYRLAVTGMVRQPLELSLAELSASKRQQTVTATMTCAGNRRSEHSRVKQVKGVPWEAGAIGNAQWTGVPLAAVLKRAGVAEGAKHVWFEGLDRIEKGGETISFGGSIPLAKAMSHQAEMPGALITTKMNGEPLTPDHGSPVRMVVPGYIGARSVKWLGKIVVSDRPSPNHYVSGAYKLVTEDEPQQWERAEPIYQYPLNSAICIPAAGATVKAGRITVRGYALPSGKPDAVLRKVEASADGGRNWKQAKLIGKRQAFCWQLWEGQLPASGMQATLLVRATDTTGASQPQRVDWNLKGYLMNAWYRTEVQVES